MICQYKLEKSCEATQYHDFLFQNNTNNVTFIKRDKMNVAAALMSRFSYFIGVMYSRLGRT